MEKPSTAFPDNFEWAVQSTTEEPDAMIRLIAASKMFELGKLSSGKTAELAGLSRLDFFEMCGRFKVSIFNYPPEELEQELRTDLEVIN